MKNLILLFFLVFQTTIYSQLTPEALYSKYSGAVVFITSYTSSGNITGYGSGVLVSSDGIIYTCLHVIENGLKLEVCINKKIVNDVTVIGFDPVTDAAILKIPQCFDSEPAAISSDFSAPGELVYALGNPQGLKNTFSSGIISRIDSNSTRIIIQFSASISPGSSGGALFNSKGELIGLPSSYYTTGQNLNFAIPVSEFKIIPNIDPANPDQLNIIRSLINRHTGNTDRTDMDRDKLASALYTLSEENPDNYRYIGRMFSFLKLYDSAVVYFTKAIQLDPGRKELYVNRGEVYYDLAADVNALQDFREAISLDHNYIDAFEKRGNLYADKMSKYEMAIDDYSMVLHLEPERIDLFILRADCWLNLGDTSNAINDFSNYVNYFPNDWIYYRRGRLNYSQANYRQAADDYTQAILLNNQECVYYYSRGITRSRLGENYLAIKDYEQYMNLSDGSDKPFNNMGYCYLSAGDFKMAEYCFNMAVESDTENFDSYLGLAVMHYRQGKMKRACECIVKAIKIKPVIEKGSKGLDEIKKSGFFWEDNELIDLNKIFMVMGIDYKTIPITSKAKPMKEEDLD